MSKPEMGSIFHIKNHWNILVIWNYYVNYQNFQNLMRLTSSDTKRTLMIYSCLQIPPKENWFQYVHRVYTTAINFPCITFLIDPILLFIFQNKQLDLSSWNIHVQFVQIWQELYHTWLNDQYPPLYSLFFQIRLQTFLEKANKLNYNALENYDKVESNNAKLQHLKQN